MHAMKMAVLRCRLSPEFGCGFGELGGVSFFIEVALEVGIWWFLTGSADLLLLQRLRMLRRLLISGVGDVALSSFRCSGGSGEVGVKTIWLIPGQGRRCFRHSVFAQLNHSTGLRRCGGSLRRTVGFASGSMVNGEIHWILMACVGHWFLIAGLSIQHHKSTRLASSD
ncbi:unnamed protein product [Arabidopsis halleri]